MNICTIIKELRLTYKMTQEELAFRLGVSPQAVSRWENGVTYPDISLISSIAQVFNVTTDRLLCGEESKNNREIDNAISKADEVLKESDNKDFLTPLNIVKEKLIKYPNNEKLIIEVLHRITAYAFGLDKFDYSEAIMLCEKILAISKNDWYREEAKIIMLDCYVKSNLKDKAIEIMESIPVTLSPYQLKMRIYEKGSTEYIEANRKNNYFKLNELLESMFSELDCIGHQSDEELLKRYIGIEKIIEEVCGVNLNESRMMPFKMNYVYIMIIKKSIKIKDEMLTMNYLEKLVNLATGFVTTDGKKPLKEYDKDFIMSYKQLSKFENVEKYNELFKKLQ